MFQVHEMNSAVPKVDRDSDLGDDSPLSNSPEEEEDDDDEIRDDDASSDEGVNVKQMANTNSNPNVPTAMNFGNGPNRHSELLNQSPHFGQNHPLGVLENLSALNMNVKHLSNPLNGDVLEKLKLQVREMKMNSTMENDFPLHSIFSGHQAQNYSLTNGLSHNNNNNNNNHHAKEAIQTSSNASTSNSSENNGWSFEEQFKQVRQLYEINDDPKRKPFLDDLFAFMASKGQPINRLPIMAKSVLDLYELYKLVVARGGLVEVIQKKLWQEIIKGLHLPSSITSAAFTLRTQYMKYLFDYECSKYGFSTRNELDAAIEGNKREGRRSSYGQFEQQFAKQNPLSQGMTPLSLMSHGANQAQHPLLGAGATPSPNLGQLADLFNADIGETMINYLKMIQARGEQRDRAQSPEAMTPQDAINLQMEMSRVALWGMYANNTSPPHSMNNTSPQEAQREPIVLRRSPSPAHLTRKREFEEREEDEEDVEMRGKDYTMQPPMKKTHIEASPVRTQTPIKRQIKEEKKEEDEEKEKITENVVSGGITGMQFKIVNTGEPQLIVSMEVNGVQYEGVLFSNKNQQVPNESPLKRLNDDRGSQPLSLVL